MGALLLKPCPFCGSKNLDIIDVEFTDGQPLVDGYTVVCFNCSMIGPTLYNLVQPGASRKVIEVWNNRIGDK